MHFDSSQQEILSTTLTSLLYYVNERAHIVLENDTGDDHERLTKSQLIERHIWSHLELIDDFVRDNPDRLSQTHLECAASLTGTLYGTLYLESCTTEQVTLVHHTGVYTVINPDSSFPDLAADSPLELRGAIAPFRDIIVPIPPFSVMGQVSQAQLERLHEELRRCGTDMPTDKAHDLAQRARAWHDAHVREAKNNQKHVTRIGPGYHRGVLASLSMTDREQAQRAHDETSLLASDTYRRIMDTLSIEVERFPRNLTEALHTLDDDWLREIAEDVSGEIVSPTLPTRRLIALIRTCIESNEAALAATLSCCLDEQFDLIARLAHSNPLTLDELPPSLASHLYPLLPYSFIFRCEGSLKAWMPKEAAGLLSLVDLEAIRATRKRHREALMAARGLATMCGIVSVTNVYERYRRAVDQPLGRWEFESILNGFQSCACRDDYALWRHMSCDYVVSVEISDASAAARVMRESFSGSIISEGMGPGEPLLVGLSADEDDEFQRRLLQKQEELERARLALLAHKRPQFPPDLPAAMLKKTPLKALMELEALEALRAFVETHIPDDEDDYSFAEQFCRSIIVSATLMCEDYNDTMDIIRLYGMQHCEGTDYSDTLGRLVTNAYNALPRWDLNGWSLEQNTERLTGRRRFYNQDGTPRELDDRDLCPCGSGKMYGRCCGKLR